MALVGTALSNEVLPRTSSRKKRKMMTKSIEQGGKEGRSEVEWKIGEE